MNNSRAIYEYEIALFKTILNKKKMKEKTKDLKKLRCAIYARKSQIDEKDTSLITQINYCTDLISQCDILELTSTYQEDNRSGMWDNREEFQKMISAVEQNEIDVVVVYKWDRFARKSCDTQIYYNKIVQCGGTVLAGDSTFNIDSAQSLFMQQIMWNNSEYQARATAERAIQTMINISKQNRYVAGKAPYGYNQINQKLEINIDEAIVIKNIFEKLSAGESIINVVEYLKEQGIKNRNDNFFSKQNISYIARNKIYIGTLCYNKFGARKQKHRILQKDFEEVIIENSHDNIISKETFDRVQNILDNKKKCKFHDSGHVYLLAGLIKCKCCNKIMVGNSQRGR